MEKVREMSEVPEVSSKCACRTYEGFIEVCKEWNRDITSKETRDGSDVWLTPEVRSSFNTWMDGLTKLRRSQIGDRDYVFGCRLKYEREEIGWERGVKSIIEDISEELFYDIAEWRVLRAVLNNQSNEGITCRYKIRCVDGVEVEVGYSTAGKGQGYAREMFTARVSMGCIKNRDTSDNNIILVKKNRIDLGSISIDMKYDDGDDV